MSLISHIKNPFFFFYPFLQNLELLKTLKSNFVEKYKNNDNIKYTCTGEQLNIEYKLIKNL
jgi:hypothetical protein